MKKFNIPQIVKDVARAFPSFGGGKTSEFNPITAALKDREPMFAAGVSIEAVVNFILEKAKEEK